jgi:hypothetical protein
VFGSGNTHMPQMHMHAHTPHMPHMHAHTHGIDTHHVPQHQYQYQNHGSHRPQGHALEPHAPMHATHAPHMAPRHMPHMHMGHHSPMVMPHMLAPAVPHVHVPAVKSSCDAGCNTLLTFSKVHNCLVYTTDIPTYTDL